jgi:hypothetical protein
MVSLNLNEDTELFVSPLSLPPTRAKLTQS